MFKILMLFFVSLNSFAAVDKAVIVKSLDGKIARCSEDRNIGVHAYRPSAFEMSASDSSVLVNVSVQSLKCLKVGAQFVWALQSFNAPMISKTIDGRVIEKQLRNQEFRLINQAYQLLGAVGVSSEKFVEAKYNIDISQALSAEELARLNSGEIAKGQLSFYMWSLSSYTIDGKTTNGGQKTGGSYNINFEVQNTPQGIVIRSAFFQ